MPVLYELTKRVHDGLIAAGKTLATAESCTGGLLASSITDHPGSSAYFKGGIVAYANSAKISILGVDAGLIARAGAVDARVAIEMAEGARRALGADFAVSTTGIVGPDGGTADKPAGLVYIGVASPSGVSSHRFNFSGGRAEVRQSTAEMCFELLIAAIAKSGV